MFIIKRLFHWQRRISFLGFPHKNTLQQRGPKCFRHLRLMATRSKEQKTCLPLVLEKRNHTNITTHVEIGNIRYTPFTSSQLDFFEAANLFHLKLLQFKLMFLTLSSSLFLTLPFFSIFKQNSIVLFSLQLQLLDLQSKISRTTLICFRIVYQLFLITKDVLLYNDSTSNTWSSRLDSVLRKLTL